VKIEYRKKFLKEIKIKTRQALSFLSMHEPSLDAKKTCIDIAAQNCLYPHPDFPSCSLLPPTIPSNLHSFFTIYPQLENPHILYKKIHDSLRRGRQIC